MAQSSLDPPWCSLRHNQHLLTRDYSDHSWFITSESTSYNWVGDNMVQISLRIQCWKLKCFILHCFPSQYSNNPVYRRIYQHMERKKSYVQSMEEGVRRTQEGNFAFIGEAVSLDLAVARYCKLTRSQEVIGMRGYAIAAPLGEWLWPVTMFSVVFDQRITHQWNCLVFLSDLSVQIPMFTMFSFIAELLHLSNKFIISPVQICVKFCLFWSDHK